jgi:hypothetical protein
MIDGQLVMENKVVRTIDKAVVLKEADVSIKRLIKRAAI